MPKSEKFGRWHHFSRRKPATKALLEENEQSREEPPKAVIFVQNTCDSELATEVIEMIQSLRPWTGLNVKVVERAGHKLQDLLCKSNPWDSLDCSRPNCFTCETALESKRENCAIKNCRQRSIIYQTWCEKCLEDGKLSIENGENVD